VGLLNSHLTIARDMRYLCLIFAISLTSTSPLIAQRTGLRVISPVPNYEVCLGDEVPIAYSVQNADSVSRTLVFHVEIQNVVTGIQVDSAWDTLYNVAPAATINSSFPAYQTNPNILRELGTFYLSATLIALDSSKHPIVGWPFRQSIIQRLFGIRRTAQPYRDASNYYSHTVTGNIPDQTLWASLGATVVEGDSETWDPPPPRASEKKDTYGADSFYSPVIRLDRMDVNGNLYAGNGAGDTLISFPINLQGQSRVILKFDFMRGGKLLYPALFDKTKMIAPEQTLLGPTGSVVRAGDSLVLEFKTIGDSECNPTRWDRIAAIDGGRDFEFKTFQLTLKHSDSTLTYHITGDSVLTAVPFKGYLDNNFRFRLRLKAKNDGGSSGTDDNDPWYIDNPSVTVPRTPEIEVSWVRVITPYTKLPRSGAAAIPVYIKIKNNSSDLAVGFPLKVTIADNQGDTFYNKSVQITSLHGSGDSVIRMPDWDARQLSNSTYPLIANAWLDQPGFDNHDEDDGTFTKFYLNVSQSSIQEFAYDDAGMEPGIGAGNDVPNITGIKGRGLGFSNGTGSYAVKFTLPVRDTLLGARAYFASANAADDAIRISLLQDKPEKCTPGDTVQLPGIQSVFGARREGGFFNNFWPYYFPKPIVLEPGTYWLSVSQLSLNSMMLGGDASRGGAVLTVNNPLRPVIDAIYSDPYGSQWSPDHNNGDISCAFAYENTASSGLWTPLMPDTGKWPMQVGVDGSGTFLPMIRVMMSNTGSASVTQIARPNELSFESYPNPFTLGASYADLSFSLPSSANTSLTIYDEMGREVRTLVRGVWEQGAHTVHWDGRDAGGSYAASGTYVCGLIAGNQRSYLRMVIVR